MKPKISYTIWFSQRNGSTLLSEGLTSTGVAGRPGEHFLRPANTSLLDHYEARNYQELQHKIWERGLTPNGVFGIKTNAPRREHDPLIRELAKFPGMSDANPSNFAVWENAFPNGRHIFLTRRNKVGQAVSWWKAIVTGEWHRTNNNPRPYALSDIEGRYDFDAIHHLLTEATFLESKIQDFFDEHRIVPLTIVYEDFIREYEPTIRRIIDFLGIEDTDYPIAPPHYQPLADEVSDRWADQFREEMQTSWKRKVW